jgi:hypothetical protein
VGQLDALESRLQRLLREVQAGQRTLAQGTGERRDELASPRESAVRASESSGRS